MDETKLEDIVSLCKRRGFIYPGSDIYGGLSGTWDYGPLGVALKRNIMQLWWKMFVEDADDMLGVDAAILMNQKVWQASGHVDTFTDPLVECGNCHNRFRADHLIYDALEKNKRSQAPVITEQVTGTLDNIKTNLGALRPKCPNCGQQKWEDPRHFNMMFKTSVGPVADENSISYLRPETAQGIFTNFKNVVDSFYPDIPFGIAQQGKAFRNEISPRDFIFRSREFEQMEIEYFVHPDAWQISFEFWVKKVHEWCEALGLPAENVHELEVPEADRAHYSKRTVDFEFDFPIGREELLGLAYRTDFDLKNIERVSGKSMSYRPKDGGEPFVPHVIEPSFGVERALMAVLSAAYREDKVNGEKRIYLQLPAHLAPVKAAVSPLLKNKPELVDKAREVYRMLKNPPADMPGPRSLYQGAVMWDDNGNIGKRYRRQDEIGTPECIVIDFQTLEDDTVSIRDRDTTNQTRMSMVDLKLKSSFITFEK